MIHGVHTKQLINHPDERGYFEEVIRSTDEFFSEGFAQLSRSHMVTGVVKAWHIHKTQIDWWYGVSGIIKAVLFDMRDTSPTFHELNEYMLNDADKRIVLKIPPGVAHGLKVMSGPADLVYITSSIYSLDQEGRIPYDDKSIGYDWIDGMEITNTKIT